MQELVSVEMEVERYAEFVALAAAEENYKPRRCLGGATAKEVYSIRQLTTVSDFPCQP